MNFSLGIGLALLAHAGIFLFGGMLLGNKSKDHGSLQQVALLSEQEMAAEKKQEEKKKEQQEHKDTSEEMKNENEQVPDAAEMIRNMEQPANNMPALEAASLSAIEAALSGAAPGGGDFAEVLTFSSGGRIGGTGKAMAAVNESFDNAFSLAEIDQKPRVIFQAAPVFPAGMKSVEGVVSLIFVVDENGKVVNPRVEKSSHTAFEKPAMEAVKQWKFEPGVKGGKRVSCKMRVPIRFQAT